LRRVQRIQKHCGPRNIAFLPGQMYQQQGGGHGFLLGIFVPIHQACQAIFPIAKSRIIGSRHQHAEKGAQRHLCLDLFG